MTETRCLNCAPHDTLDASTSAWIRQGYIDDKAAKSMSEKQNRQFLCTGIKPVIGQGAELLLLMDREQARDVHLSGQVVSIGEEPEKIFPKSSDNDQHGSNILSQMLGHFIYKEGMELLDGVSFDPCKCGAPDCHNEGSFFFPRAVWEEHLNGEGKEAYQKVVEVAERFLAAKHGQRVVCEGRLNFDHDMRRGHDNGPWADGIPIDGQNIYSWELVFNDHLVNKWTLDCDSLCNLGPDRHPRCWPWSNENQLPYHRTGVDCVCREEDGIMMFHHCIGPFGCDADEHNHDFAGAA